jgi:hypothetical protein
MIEEKRPENIRIKGCEQDSRMAFDYDGCSREQIEWMQSKFMLLKGRVSFSVLMRYAIDLLYQKLVGKDADFLLDEWEVLKKYAASREKMPDCGMRRLQDYLTWAEERGLDYGLGEEEEDDEDYY